MKKFKLLFVLFLFLSLKTFAKEEDFQKILKNQRERVAEMIISLSSINDISIRDYLYQIRITPILTKINEQSTTKKVNEFLNYNIYFSSGLIAAYQKIDQKVQEYKNFYDKLSNVEKPTGVNPYEFIYIKEGENWYDNPKNDIFFYLPMRSELLQKYTINNLCQYLQKYVDCVNVGICLKRNKVTKCLYDYDEKYQKLADLIIQLMMEFHNVRYTWTYDWSDYCSAINNFGVDFCNVLDKNLSIQDSFKKIELVVHSLFPKQYNDVMEELSIDFKQKGLDSSQIKQEVEKKLNNIIHTYANKLFEKVKGINICKKKLNIINKKVKEGIMSKAVEDNAGLCR